MMETNSSASSLVLPEIHVSLQVLEVTSIAIILVFGLFGNLCVCFVVFKNCDLWTVPNFLIVNLSISDLFRLVFSLTISCTVLITREWIGNDIFCQINGFYTLVFLSTSLLCVTLISINRYFIIVKPSQSADIFSRRHTKLMVGFVWFIGIVTAIPPLLGLGRYDFNASRATCFIANGSSDSYTSILVIILIGVPCSVTIWCYIRVFVTIRLSQERLSVQNAIVPQNSVPTKQARPRLSHREVSSVYIRHECVFLFQFCLSCFYLKFNCSLKAFSVFYYYYFVFFRSSGLIIM